MNRKTRTIHTILKSRPWAYLYHKFFCELDLIDKDAFWERSQFVQLMVMDSADYILSGQASA